jgi:hypothetical protein
MVAGMTMPADGVDVVIGVDTHEYTHTAEVVGSTDAAADERRLTADADDYASCGCTKSVPLPGGGQAGGHPWGYLPSP